MSKYIDTEKLTKFEETLADIIVSSQGLCTYEACKDVAKSEAPFLIASLQQEQPEVDFNEEVERFAKECGYPSAATIDFQFARHFYELGLNARKEE